MNGTARSLAQRTFYSLYPMCVEISEKTEKKSEGVQSVLDFLVSYYEFVHENPHLVRPLPSEEVSGEEGKGVFLLLWERLTKKKKKKKKKKK